MKNLLLTFVCLFAFTQMSTSQESSNEIKEIQWENVEVFYELEHVEHYTKGERLTETLKTSLNFGGKSKLEGHCLKKLQKQAAKKGYPIIYVDKGASSTKRFDKRGIKIILIARGYLDKEHHKHQDKSS